MTKKAKQSIFQEENAEASETVDKIQKNPKEAIIAGVGHNSGEVSGNRLKSFIDRVERLEEEKKACGEDVKDVYKEAKSAGFDPKIMRKIVSLKKVNKETRREENELLELYAAALQLDLGL